MPGKDVMEEFERAAFEFARRISRYEGVGHVIVFGSVAKGDVDRRSDLDVLVVLDTEREPESLEEYERVSDAALDVGRDFDKRVQLVVTNRVFSGLDEFFVETALTEGKVLYGKAVTLETQKLRLEPHYIIMFSLEDLEQSDKMRVKRRLYGRVSRRVYKGKEYVSKYEGLVREEGGVALGRGCILVPAKSLGNFEQVFKELGVRYKKTTTWISSYNIPKGLNRRD
jgi:predicted nucleotidyltransferase